MKLRKLQVACKIVAIALPNYSATTFPVFAFAEFAIESCILYFVFLFFSGQNIMLVTASVMYFSFFACLLTQMLTEAAIITEHVKPTPLAEWGTKCDHRHFCKILEKYVDTRCWKHLLSLHDKECHILVGQFMQVKCIHVKYVNGKYKWLFVLFHKFAVTFLFCYHSCFL